MPANPGERGKDSTEEKRGNHERKREPKPVSDAQNRRARGVVCANGEGLHRDERRADTRDPPDGEDDSEEWRTPHPGARLPLWKEIPLQCRDPSGEDDAQKNEKNARHPQHDVEIGNQQKPESPEHYRQRNENEPHPRNKAENSQKGAAAIGRRRLGGQSKTRDVGDVAGHERNDAWREKREEPREECDG
ncbi:unannotated protein [freshwater metagenome]|uniref:Unannotated protein n=1 Tax=freshwater metagenome TaxID=449393 RepID=A0A6J6FQ03_9ZZZZ